ncbi:MAG: bifunctional diaminohydroxyphosphoribosylaminopyrimidine deaminase/5-amino-6-(5-phosphoribosylamino)uracil reductase RibD [Gammaproteobacteria bacterium]|jgi:diaminohydroxyphosphoribosylaminopyrimidine deaminase/5-amino-6-(5-phosphoribosylamino)uracil reductase
MYSTDDHRYMAEALRLAERGLYSTDPNPRVGCVLVRDGEIVGRGWHVRAGEGHAEVNALQQAGALAAGATAYVTLEPCCHQGRTPPCTEALVNAGVAQVVAAMEDPNPRVAGQGLRRLREAGIDATAGLLAAEAARLNPGFVMRMQHGRPWVRCKLAMSLDGRTAMANGESRWITGEQARRDVHRLRARSSAILTGIGTVQADDPMLTVRLAGEDASRARQPLRVILDTRLRIRPDARLLDLPGKTLIISGVKDLDKEDQLALAGVSVATLPLTTGRLDLEAVLRHLGSIEINEVHVEAGADLSGALLQAGLIDELVVYMAPHLMGDTARGLFSLPALKLMEQRVELTISDIRAVGRDWRITATVKQDGT